MFFEDAGRRVDEGLEEAGKRINDVAAQANELADQAWSDLAVEDKMDQASQTASELSDAAWSAATETAENASDAVVEGAKDGSYLVARTGLGAADVVEDAYKGGRVWTEKVMGHDDVAVEVAQANYVDQMVDDLNEVYQVSDGVKVAGDVAQGAGKLAAEIGLGAVATVAAAPVAVVSGGMTVAAVAGESLEKSAEDGELSTLDMAASAAAAGVTAATIGVGRHMAKAAEVAEKEVAQVGGSYKDVKALVDSEKYEVHHIPANSINNLETKDGPCIAMTERDHRQTASWGRSLEAAEYRAEQARLVEEGKPGEALLMDIADITEKFPGKYDEAISQAVEYATKLGWF